MYLKERADKRWHGPAIVLGGEGLSALYLGYRGRVTKRAPESVRLASATELMSYEAQRAGLEAMLHIAASRFEG